MRQKVRKIFFSYKKEEDWINQMAQSGKNLISVGWAQYFFEENEPGEYFYRLELNEADPQSEKGRDYIAFLSDAGVEVAATYGRWLYLRKLSEEGPFDLFSDPESKVSYLKRLERFWMTIGLVETVIGLTVLLNFLNFNLHWAAAGKGLPYSVLSLVGFIFGGLCLAVGLGILFFLYRPIRSDRKNLEKEREIYA